jgi:hypothetical protein
VSSRRRLSNAATGSVPSSYTAALPEERQTRATVQNRSSAGPAGQHLRQLSVPPIMEAEKTPAKPNKTFGDIMMSPRRATRPLIRFVLMAVGAATLLLLMARSFTSPQTIATTLDRMPLNKEDIREYVSWRSGSSGTRADNCSHFTTFEGRNDCNFGSNSLYVSPRHHPHNHTGGVEDFSYCPTREYLLQAMSTGAREGFDSPYIPDGGHLY